MIGRRRVAAIGARQQRALASVCAAVLTLTISAAVHAQLPTGEPARFLQRHIGLTSRQIEQAQRGEVVTKVLDTRDPDEVALFGIVAVNASRADIVRRVHNLTSYLRAPGRTAFGIFGAPATVADAATFVADPSDVDALRECRPADCNVKMPAATIEEFRRGIDWESPSVTTHINALVRQRMVEYVETYRRGGTSAMVEYGDQKSTRRAGDVFASLLGESPYLFEYLPSLHEYLKRYPSGSLAGVTDAIYWSSDKMSSLRPILGITHLSVYTPPDAPLALVSAKQLYASHYFVGAFTLTTILDRSDAATGAGGTYYMVVQRMRFDRLPSGGLLNIRGRVIGKMHEALREDLAQRKASLEQPPK